MKFSDVIHTHTHTHTHTYIFIHIYMHASDWMQCKGVTFMLMNCWHWNPVGLSNTLQWIILNWFCLAALSYALECYCYIQLYCHCTADTPPIPDVMMVRASDIRLNPCANNTQTCHFAKYIAELEFGAESRGRTREAWRILLRSSHLFARLLPFSQHFWDSVLVYIFQSSSPWRVQAYWLMTESRMNSVADKQSSSSHNAKSLTSRPSVCLFSHYYYYYY